MSTDDTKSLYMAGVEPLDLLIVIVNYRAESLVIDCLRSLAPQITDIPQVRVAICENGTGEHAVEFLRDEIIRNGWAEWVVLKAISPNRGFTGGNNSILRDALAASAPPRYLLLLNADTVVRPGAIKAMCDAMEASFDVGIAVPKLVDDQGQTQHSEFQDFTPLSEFLQAASVGVLNRAFGRRAFPLEPRPGSPDVWLSFACAMFRREVFLQLGILDEGFFLYFDDADFSRTARLAGWRLLSVPHAEVLHLEGQSTGVPGLARHRNRRPRYYYVSRARYFAKHRGIAGLWIANVAWQLGRLVSMLRELLQRKSPSACDREWLDNWTNCLAPISKSNPQLPPVAQRIVVPLQK